jgi:hypothetical protein
MQLTLGHFIDRDYNVNILIAKDAINRSFKVSLAFRSLLR